MHHKCSSHYLIFLHHVEPGPVFPGKSVCHSGASSSMLHQVLRLMVCALPPVSTWCSQCALISTICPKLWFHLIHSTVGFYFEQHYDLDTMVGDKNTINKNKIDKTPFPHGTWGKFPQWSKISGPNWCWNPPLPQSSHMGLISTPSTLEWPHFGSLNLLRKEFKWNLMSAPHWGLPKAHSPLPVSESLSPTAGPLLRPLPFTGPDLPKRPARGLKKHP